MSAERLDKILVSQGLGSRREMQAQIRRGEVSVNGKAVYQPECKVDSDSDTITVGGISLHVQKYVYYMLNKPDGVVSASRDPNAKTVIDLFPEQLRRRNLFPAGRLDKDTQGLLIITDDGDFAHRMLAPKNEVYKQYEAVVRDAISPEDVRAFAEGIVFEDGTVCRRAQLSLMAQGEHPTVSVRIHEGKYHQVKKMFLARGNLVLTLRRTKIGALCLDEGLLPGEYRALTEEEKEQIFTP